MADTVKAYRLPLFLCCAVYRQSVLSPRKKNTVLRTAVCRCSDTTKRQVLPSSSTSTRIFTAKRNITGYRQVRTITVKNAYYRLPFENHRHTNCTTCPVSLPYYKALPENALKILGLIFPAVVMISHRICEL